MLDLGLEERGKGTDIFTGGISRKTSFGVVAKDDRNEG